MNPLVHKLALDLDDTVTATHALVREAFAAAGYEVPLHIHRYSDWAHHGLTPPLSEEENDRILFSVVRSAKWAERLQPLPGAIEGIQQLLSLGLGIDILTARGSEPIEVELARRFLEKHGFRFLIIGVGWEPKGNYIDGHTMMVDDRLSALQTMPPGVHRLLFRCPSNEHFWHTGPDGTIPVSDWPHLVETVRDLIR